MTLDGRSIQSFSVFDKFGQFYSIPMVEISNWRIYAKIAGDTCIEFFIRALDHPV